MIYKDEILQLANLKKGMANLVGQKVLLKKTLGKSKTMEKTVVVEETYPWTFCVKVGEELKESYTYADVLSKNVEVSIYDGENFNPYTAPFNLK